MGDVLAFEADGGGGVVMLQAPVQTEADVVKHLLEMLESSAEGSIAAPQCCSSLYAAHPSFKEVVKAGGGLRKVCERHADVLAFEADGGGGVVMLQAPVQ